MWAIVKNNTVLEIIRDPKTVKIDGVNYPAGIFMSWTTAQLNNKGVYDLVLDPIPNLEQYKITGSYYDIINTTVYERWQTIVKPTQEITGELASFKLQAINAVDTQAGECRKQFITSIPGQEMTYLEKVYESRAALADTINNRIKSTYFLISGEIGITVPDTSVETTDITNVANAILINYEMFRTVGAAIEKIRLTAKKNIADSTSITQIRGILSSLIWPTTGGI